MNFHTSLYAHQKRIISDDPAKAGLFLGTGTGKTRTALMLARGGVLVIAPKTQVHDQNWERELMSIIGPAPRDPHISGMLVVSKETFRRDHEILPEFDTVIVDEAHTCLGATPNVRWRNRVAYPKTSQLFEALQLYIERTKPARLYLCTATIVRNPMTVWAALNLLGDERNFYEWRDFYYTKLPMPGREVWVPKTSDVVKESLAQEVRDIGYVGRLEDFFDVPDQSFKTIHIELTAAQKKRIVELKTEYPEPIVRVGKRHQVENGVLSGDEFNAAEFFDNGKIEKILELAIEFPRMVIFAKYRAQIDAIEKALVAEKKTVLTLTGDTKDRLSAFKEAKKRLNCVFICQAQISAGWELPEYPVMVFASRTYSFVDYDQALGRIQRANGIKKNLYINLVVKGGVDEAVDKSLRNKQSFNEAIYAEEGS